MINEKTQQRLRIRSENFKEGIAHSRSDDPLGSMSLDAIIQPMFALKGLAWLLVFQSAGEAITRVAHLPLPGPVIGMLLLMPALGMQTVRVPVAAAAEVLLANLSLLFVPVGVGVMTHLDLIGAYGVRMLVVIAASTWIGLGVTAWSLNRLLSTRP